MLLAHEFRQASPFSLNMPYTLIGRNPRLSRYSARFFLALQAGDSLDIFVPFARTRSGRTEVPVRSSMHGIPFPFSVGAVQAAARPLRPSPIPLHAGPLLYPQGERNEHLVLVVDLLGALP